MEDRDKLEMNSLLKKIEDRERCPGMSTVLDTEQSILLDHAMNEHYGKYASLAAVRDRQGVVKLYEEEAMQRETRESVYIQGKTILGHGTSRNGMNLYSQLTQLDNWKKDNVHRNCELTDNIRMENTNADWACSKNENISVKSEKMTARRLSEDLPKFRQTENEKATEMQNREQIRRTTFFDRSESSVAEPTSTSEAEKLFTKLQMKTGAVQQSPRSIALRNELSNLTRMERPEGIVDWANYEINAAGYNLPKDHPQKSDLLATPTTKKRLFEIPARTDQNLRDTGSSRQSYTAEETFKKLEKLKKIRQEISDWDKTIDVSHWGKTESPMDIVTGEKVENNNNSVYACHPDTISKRTLSNDLRESCQLLKDQNHAKEAKRKFLRCKDRLKKTYENDDDMIEELAYDIRVLRKTDFDDLDIVIDENGDLILNVVVISTCKKGRRKVAPVISTPSKKSSTDLSDSDRTNEDSEPPSSCGSFNNILQREGTETGNDGVNGMDNEVNQGDNDQNGDKHKEAPGKRKMPRITYRNLNILPFPRNVGGGEDNLQVSDKESRGMASEGTVDDVPLETMREFTEEISLCLIEDIEKHPWLENEGRKMHEDLRAVNSFSISPTVVKSPPMCFEDTYSKRKRDCHASGTPNDWYWEYENRLHESRDSRIDEAKLGEQSRKLRQMSVKEMYDRQDTLIWMRNLVLVNAARYELEMLQQGFISTVFDVLLREDGIVFRECHYIGNGKVNGEAVCLKFVETQPMGPSLVDAINWHPHIPEAKLDDRRKTLGVDNGCNSGDNDSELDEPENSGKDTKSLSTQDRKYSSNGYSKFGFKYSTTNSPGPSKPKIPVHPSNRSQTNNNTSCPPSCSSNVASKSGIKSSTQHRYHSKYAPSHGVKAPGYSPGCPNAFGTSYSSESNMQSTSCHGKKPYAPLYGLSAPPKYLKKHNPHHQATKTCRNVNNNNRKPVARSKIKPVSILKNGRANYSDQMFSDENLLSVYNSNYMFEDKTDAGPSTSKLENAPEKDESGVLVENPALEGKPQEAASEHVAIAETSWEDLDTYGSQLLELKTSHSEEQEKLETPSQSSVEPTCIVDVEDGEQADVEPNPTGESAEPADEVASCSTNGRKAGRRATIRSPGPDCVQCCPLEPPICLKFYQEDITESANNHELMEPIPEVNYEDKVAEPPRKPVATSSRSKKPWFKSMFNPNKKTPHATPGPSINKVTPPGGAGSSKVTTPVAGSSRVTSVKAPTSENITKPHANSATPPVQKKVQPRIRPPVDNKVAKENTDNRRIKKPVQPSKPLTTNHDGEKLQ